MKRVIQATMMAVIISATIIISRPGMARDGQVYVELPPSGTVYLADQAGGLWIITKGPNKQELVRYCRSSIETTCGPWLDPASDLRAVNKGKITDKIKVEADEEVTDPTQ
ncbi:MAG: hypothetical protein AAF530_25175 [Pseudomonadota bacterium]